MSGTTPLSRSLAALLEFFDKRGWKHCLIGGLAANRWGKARFTRDIDIVVLTGVGDEETVVDELLAAFPSRLAKQEARQFALDHRVLLLESNAGVPIDVSLGAIAFEEQMLGRARLSTIVSGQRYPVASPEDLIVMKALAGRSQDWQDIEGIIARQGRKLDWTHIQKWLDPLLEAIGQVERAQQLAAIRKRLASESRSTRGGRKPKISPDKRKPKDK